MPEIEIWPYEQMIYMYNPESIPENEMCEILKGFEIQTDHQISARRPDPAIVKLKKKKPKENEKRDMYVDFARELEKKLWSVDEWALSYFSLS